MPWPSAVAVRRCRVHGRCRWRRRWRGRCRCRSRRCRCRGRGRCRCRVPTACPSDRRRLSASSSPCSSSNGNVPGYPYTTDVGRGWRRAISSHVRAAKTRAPAAGVSGRTAHRWRSSNQPTSSVCRTRLSSTRAMRHVDTVHGAVPARGLHAEQHDGELPAGAVGARRLAADDRLDLVLGQDLLQSPRRGPRAAAAGVRRTHVRYPFLASLDSTLPPADHIPCAHSSASCLARHSPPLS